MIWKTLQPSESTYHNTGIKISINKTFFITLIKKILGLQHAALHQIETKYIFRRQQKSRNNPIQDSILPSRKTTLVNVFTEENSRPRSLQGSKRKMPGLPHRLLEEHPMQQNNPASTPNTSWSAQPCQNDTVEDRTMADPQQDAEEQARAQVDRPHKDHLRNGWQALENEAAQSTLLASQAIYHLPQ